MKHELDIYAKYFIAVADGTKTFEVREKRDRNFKIGDWLLLKEIDETSLLYTVKTILKQISYILDNENYCKKGYVILGLKTTTEE